MLMVGFVVRYDLVRDYSRTKCVLQCMLQCAAALRLGS